MKQKVITNVFDTEKLEQVVAGASSYSTYEKGLYPSWDAQNKWSVALAEKLGYHFSHEYVAHEVTGYQMHSGEHKKIYKRSCRI